MCVFQAKGKLVRSMAVCEEPQFEEAQVTCIIITIIILIIIISSSCSTIVIITTTHKLLLIFFPVRHLQMPPSHPAAMKMR